VIKEEMLFHKIAEKLPDTTKGKVFGAMCIKTENGKTAAIFWKGEMIIKLNDEDEKEALKLPESRLGTHLYSPERKMKNWVTIPFAHSNKWEELIKKAILNLNKIN
jgi:hypothetical protein